MSDLGNQGTINFNISHKHADWATNSNCYNFNLPQTDGVGVQATKHPDGTFELNLQNNPGKFQATLKAPLPEPMGPQAFHPNSVLAHVRWSNNGESVDLFLNGEQVDSTSGEAIC